MKILFIGGLEPSQTSRMRMQVLVDMGHDVRALDTFDRWDRLGPVSRRLQQLRGRGKTVDDLNAEIFAAGNAFIPDLVWAEKQEYVRPETFAGLKALGASLLHYTPDPYFSLPWKRTKTMDESLQLFDFLVTSKTYELDEYRKLPATVIYMPLGFGDPAHRARVPVVRRTFDSFSSDVSFLGGWEPRREALLSRVAGVDGITLKVWGYGWDHLADGRVTPRRLFAMRRNSGGLPFSVKKNSVLAATVKGGEVYGEEYAWALSSSRISLGFLRKICPDQHTTRTFEIPASGSMMLADRTAEHQEFFEEGLEAEYFDSPEELEEKLRFYLANEETRARIARNGYNRCMTSGYSYRERMTKVMEMIEE